MDSEQLKEQGDNCLRERNYEEAISFYDAVIANEPQYSNPALFSNRSLANLRLGNFNDALKDAMHCLEVNETFSRGYQRKAAALNALGRYDEAAVSAESGYKIRGSDSVCKGCVEEWVTAKQLILKPKVDDIEEQIQFPVPKEFHPIVSDECITIFLNILLARVQQTANSISVELIQQCLVHVMEELNIQLILFGHKPIPCSKEWPEAVVTASKINPVTSKIAPSSVKTLMDISNQFTNYLAKDVDPILYLFVRPMISLMLSVVLAQCISFNTLNTNYDLVQVHCVVCLLFFEVSPLTSDLYIQQHVGVYKELLESFGITHFIFSSSERKKIEDHISKAKALLPRLANCPDTPEKKEMHETIMVSISLAMIRLNKDPGYDPVDYAPGSGKAYRRAASEKPEELKEYIRKKIAYLQTQFQHKDEDDQSHNFLSEYVVEGVEDLLWCTGGLLQINEKDFAVETLCLVESMLQVIYCEQSDMGAFTVDQAPSKFSITQTAMFLHIFLFLGVDDTLFVDMIIRWKCIYSEFCALLTQLGVGERYRKSFCATTSLRLAGKSNPNEEDFLKLVEEHEANVKDIIQDKGSMIFQVLFQQKTQQIQEALSEDQILLEYCLSPNYFDVDKYNCNTDVTGALILLQHSGQPIVRSIDFIKLEALIKQYSEVLPKAAVSETASATAKDLAMSIRRLIITPEVEDLIGSGKVMRVYVSTDSSMPVLPLDLLPFDDGQLLGEKCSIAHLSSCRELIRQNALRELCMSFKVENFNTAAKEQECVIFADPDYDLQLENEEGSSWDSFVSAFSTFFSTQTKPVLSLPETQIEAQDIELILRNSGIKVSCHLGKSATLMQALSVNSPHILHFATHGFSVNVATSKRNVFQQNFWANNETGIVLAGINTYRQKKMLRIVEEAGTGELNALGVTGMNLRDTNLVFLSSCSSSFGPYTSGESMKSLAEAFRSAGAKTVIATLWSVNDEETRKLAVHFYYEAIQPNVAPSVALLRAKKKIQEEYGHWVHWSAFVCVGEDVPLFSLYK